VTTFRSHRGAVVAPTRNTLKLQVSSAEIARMQAAAAVIDEIRARLADDPGGLLAMVAAGAQALNDWQHYPAGDVYDPRSHAQYFFHAHSPAQRSPCEYGHFHTFLRAEGMPVGVAPLVLPETAVADASPATPQAAPLKRGRRDEVSHLIAISVNARGEPIRLFTTNRWVTGETWYRGEDVIRMLDRFTIEAADGPPLLNRWVGAVVALFRPQVAGLLRLRDETVMGWRRRRRANVFEDTRLEITSSFDVDLDAQIAFLHQPRARPGSPVTGRSARLTQTADGWGEGPPY